MAKIRTNEGKLPTWAVVVITVLVVVVVLFVGGVFFTKEIVEDSLNEARSKASVAAMRAGMSSLRIDIELYYDENDEVYPQNLEVLDSISNGLYSVGSTSFEPLYAYTPDGKNYHLGVDLGDNNLSPTQESNFNSLQAGYIGGFDGTQPNIFDLKSF